MLAELTAATVALVVQNQTPMRAAPHDNAPRQAALTAGDWLEVRGEHHGYLEVYDHRRERPGYVRPSSVRSYTPGEGAAPGLAAVVDYLRDSPGSESLGIGYVALYLRAAPASAPLADAFDALGTMAERLADRASVRVAKAGDASLAAEVETAESYGVHFVGFEREGRTRFCYDGEAFRRVLALGGTGPERVRAALGLTEPECVDPALGATAALSLAKWGASVLDAVNPSALGPEVLADERARLCLRQSIVDSQLAYLAARAGDDAGAKAASHAARHELALVNRSVMADDDRPTYDEAALRAGAVRWAGESTPSAPAGSGLAIEIARGEPGQTCVRLKQASKAAPFEHCTYGHVWGSSLRVAPHDAAVAMVVQPLDGWSELLVLHPGSAAESGWVAETLPPASFDPDLGYVDLLGFSPDGAHMLVARELRASGPLGSPHTLAPWVTRTFQAVAATGLRVESEAPRLAGLPAAKRWDTADSRRGSLAMR